MLPSIPQGASVQAPSLQSSQQSSSGGGTSGSITAKDLEKSSSVSRDNVVPEVQVEIRSEAAVAREAQVVSAIDSIDEADVRASPTQVPVSQASEVIEAAQDQAPKAPQQVADMAKNGGDVSGVDQSVEQSSESNSYDASLASNYGQNASEAGSKGNALDIVV